MTSLGKVYSLGASLFLNVNVISKQKKQNLYVLRVSAFCLIFMCCFRDTYRIRFLSLDTHLLLLEGNPL